MVQEPREKREKCYNSGYEKGGSYSEGGLSILEEWSGELGRVFRVEAR